MNDKFKPIVTWNYTKADAKDHGFFADKIRNRIVELWEKPYVGDTNWDKLKEIRIKIS